MVYQLNIVCIKRVDTWKNRYFFRVGHCKFQDVNISLPEVAEAAALIDGTVSAADKNHMVESGSLHYAVVSIPLG